MARLYDTNSAETNKLWSRRLWHEYRIGDAVFNPKIGLTGSDPTKSAFVYIDDLEKAEGDRVRTILALQMDDVPGTLGDEVLEGKEDDITTATFDLVIDQIRHGVRTAGRMNRQRVTFNTMEIAKSRLRDWWKNRRAVMAVNHLCGNTRQSNLRYTGNNTPQAPDDKHIYRVGQGLGASNDETVGADDTALMDFDVIDELVTIAEQSDPPIAPFQIDGGEYYGLLMHPDCIADLRNVNSQWYDIMTKALQGGQFAGNPLFTRALGMWRGCLIFSEPHIVRGTNSSTAAAVDTARRNVFIGAGSLVMAYGRRQKGQKEQMYWHSGSWDHGDKYYASAASILGFASPYFTLDGTQRDYAKIVVTAYTTSRINDAKDLHQKYA